MNENINQNTSERGEDHFIKDQWGREYHFRIDSFRSGAGIISEAFEVKEDDSPGYHFHLRILSGYDDKA